MSFERNFYKASAVCPKCGLGNPEPRYVPVDTREYLMAMDMYFEYKASLTVFDMTIGEGITEPDFKVLTKPDRVDCLCRCGHQWSEKP
jgi:hypothetical protein